MSHAKAARLEKELVKLQRDAQKLKRGRAYWNRHITDDALDKLREEYARKHSEWRALKAQTEMGV